MEAWTLTNFTLGKRTGYHVFTYYHKTHFQGRMDNRPDSVIHPLTLKSTRPPHRPSIGCTPKLLEWTNLDSLGYTWTSGIRCRFWSCVIYGRNIADSPVPLSLHTIYLVHPCYISVFRCQRTTAEWMFRRRCFCRQTLCKLHTKSETGWGGRKADRRIEWTWSRGKSVVPVLQHVAVNIDGSVITC